jgi:hypothetical protein
VERRRVERRGPHGLDCGDVVDDDTYPCMESHS